MQRLNDNKGITMIAMVITIIIMLILVGVTIDLSFEGGLFNTAKKGKSSVQQEEDKLELTSAVQGIMLENDIIETDDLTNTLPEKWNIEKNSSVYVCTSPSENMFIVTENGTIRSDSKLAKIDKNVINIDNAAKENILYYRIYGNSVQNGTPSLETPVEIKSVGDYDETTGKYKIPVKVSGKNLVFINNVNVSGTGKYTYKNLGDFELPSGTYTFSLNYTVKTEQPINASISIRAYGASTPEYKLISLKRTENYSSATFTIPEGSKGIRVYAYSNYTGSIYDSSCDFYNFQIEEGSEGTAYEPYIEKTFNIYLDEPLRKVGEYADYIDLLSGEVVRNIVHLPIKNKTWKEQSGTDKFYFIQGIPLAKSQLKAFMGSNFLPISTIGTTTTGIGFQIHTNGILRVRPDLTVYDTVQKWKQFVDSNDFYVEYVLATPTAEEIELPNISMYEGKNKITVSSEVKPSDMVIVYKEK